MWTCAKCGEHVQDDFEICWACGTSIDGTEDPDFFADQVSAAPPQKVIPADPDERLITITSCSLPAEAMALRLKLEEAGIPVCLADEYTVTMDWLLSNAIGGIKVQVPDTQVAQACQVLGIELPITEEPNEDQEDDSGEGDDFDPDDEWDEDED